MCNVWVPVYCPNCLHETEALTEVYERGGMLPCPYCDALLAEYQNGPQRVIAK